MDGSETRRGSPCWHRVPEVGLEAINDALMIESSIYLLLQKYFRNKPYYAEVMETFHDVSMKNHQRPQSQSIFKYKRLLNFIWVF